MVARARIKTGVHSEKFQKYRTNLIAEDRALKVRLRMTKKPNLSIFNRLLNRFVDMAAGNRSPDQMNRIKIKAKTSRKAQRVARRGNR